MPLRSPAVLCLPLIVGLASCGSTTPAPLPPTPPDEATAQEGMAGGPPVAEVRPVSNTYHGVEVVDPYQWMEDPEDAEVQRWSDGQNVHARRHLASLPGVERIRDRVREILAAPGRSDPHLALRGDEVFALERRPPLEQPVVVVMDSVDAPDSARVLVDPMTLDPEGGISIDWFVPSPDGSLLAVSLSSGGTEHGDVHVLDVATGERVHEVVEYVNGGTAGGDLAWMPDGSGFFYTRYPRAGERPEEDQNFYQQLYFHALGSPVEGDRYELGRDLPRIAEIQLEMHDASGRLLVTVQKGDGGEFALYLRSREGRWQQFSTFGDGLVQATFGPRNDLYLVSRHEAPRGKILRMPIARLDPARATVVIPQGEDSIVTDFWEGPTVLPTRSRLFVIYQVGGPSELRVFDLRGRPKPGPEQPPVSAVGALLPLGGDAVLFRAESYVRPAAWYRFDGSDGETTETPLRDTSPVDSSDWQVRREMATSADGTRVPLNILMPAGVELDGTNACVANGYGGYGVNIEPRFRPRNALLLDQGVVFVVANLRGGSEFGELWHEQGSLTHKQNVFDDFAAVLEFLVEHRYTTRDRLAAIGGSNGGLLMGATMTQHPEIAKAIVSFVGIYDMLRVELSPNGAFNVTEFGTVEDPEQFRALHAYSPYHHVREGTAYPATLFLTGANDPRVEPWHSRKMTARLQAANAADTPILLRTSSSSGHGGGTALSERVEEWADVYAFLFSQLGVSFGPGETP